MPEDITGWLTLPAGTIVIAFAIKVIWPLLKQTLDGARIRGEAENQGYIRLMNERDLYMKRAEAAEDRADKLFEEVQKLRSELFILTHKLNMAEERLNAMLVKLNNEKGEG